MRPFSLTTLIFTLTLAVTGLAQISPLPAIGLVERTVGTGNCPVGYKWNGNGPNDCQACQAGQSSPGGSAQQCTNCAAQTSTSGNGGPCTACPSGQGNTQSGGTCQQCSGGTYSTGDGIGCRPCSSGSISGQGASSCNACAAGSYSNQAGTSCQLCAGGSYTNQPGQSQCTPCKEGYVQPGTGQTSCSPCTCGTFRQGTGQTTCDPCASGYTSPPASTSQSQCQPPAAGYGLGPDKCQVQCSGGQFSTGNTQGCQNCPNYANAISLPGSTSQQQCTNCGSGSNPDSTHTTCSPVTSPGVKSPRSRIGMICKKGHTSCAIPTRKRGQFVYECVDTSNDIQSCGGCPYDNSNPGVDCTAFDSVASASCVQGKCVYECPEGYKMTALGCSITNGARLKRSVKRMTRR